MNAYILLIFLVILIILNFVYLIYISYFRKSNVKYYKCPHKLHNVLLKEVLKDNNYEFKVDDYKLYMPCGYNNIELELDKIKIPNETKYIFGLKGCDKIVSKNNLWEIVNDNNLMPESFGIDTAILKVREGHVLIGKKNIQRKQGLKLILNEEDLRSAVEEGFNFFQIFYTNTLLINNRKINLRVYLCIIWENGKLRFYLYQNGKCLYTKKVNQKEIDFETHITSFNMDQDIYNENPHDFNELKQYVNWDKIWKDINSNLREVCKRVRHVLVQPDKFRDKTCFQLFGLDYIIRDDGKVYLLEINKGPDMTPKCDKDNKLKREVYEDTFNLVGLMNIGWRRNKYSLLL